MLYLGDTLVKMSEQLVKQTAQVLELAKIIKKDREKEEDTTLSEEDLIKISEEVKKK